VTADATAAGGPGRRSRPLHKAALAADPLRQLTNWFQEAAPTEPLPEAAALASAGLDARPSLRMVLVKHWDERGLVFYSNYESRKAVELEANPAAALLFHWPGLGRQVRVEGVVARVEAIISDDYFAERPRGAQLSARASRQSQPVSDRDALEAEVSRLADAFRDRAVPRPPWWGGYRIAPNAFEFWQHRDDRLPDRFRYERQGEGWEVTRLQP
jgi:pyridoxamine 5'-phosphate oxidase